MRPAFSDYAAVVAIADVAVRIIAFMRWTGDFPTTSASFRRGESLRYLVGARLIVCIGKLPNRGIHAIAASWHLFSSCGIAFLTHKDLTFVSLTRRDLGPRAGIFVRFRPSLPYRLCVPNYQNIVLDLTQTSKACVLISIQFAPLDVAVSAGAAASTTRVSLTVTGIRRRSAARPRQGSRTRDRA